MRPPARPGSDASEGEVLHWLDADMVAAPATRSRRSCGGTTSIDYAVVLGDKLVRGRGRAGAAHPCRAARSPWPRVSSPDDLAAGSSTRSVGRTRSWTRPTASAPPDHGRCGCTSAPPARWPGTLRRLRRHAASSCSWARTSCSATGCARPEPCSSPTGRQQACTWARAGSCVARQITNRYNKPFITDLVPEFRGHRLALSRSYAVPYRRGRAPRRRFQLRVGRGVRAGDLGRQRARPGGDAWSATGRR